MKHTMKQLISLRINEQSYDVEIDVQRTLLEVLRENIGLTGTKKGCGEGNCGSCTVIIDGKAINACLILAIEAQGKEIYTIEGLAKGGKLHPLQQSFIDHGALQCGFCTAGMIMSAKAFLDKNPHPTEEQTARAIGGNLCRCTGYTSIIQAIRAAASQHS